MCAHAKAHAEEVVGGVLLGADVNVRPAVVGKDRGVVNLTHGDVLHGACGKEVQRDKLVVGIGRGNGESVECGGAVAVAQSAHDELSGIGHGYSRKLGDAFLHVSYAFDGHFPGSHVLYGQRGLLPLHLQGALALQVAACSHHHLAQHLLVSVQGEVQRDAFCLDGHCGHLHAFVAHVAYGYGPGAVWQFKTVVSVHVGHSPLGRAGDLYGGPNKRLTRGLVCHGAFHRTCHGRHGGQDKEQ